jgi:hypothetical protein
VGLLAPCRSLTKILLAVAQQIADAQEAITFLEGDDGVGKVKGSPLAVAALKTEVARLKMDLDDVPTAQKPVPILLTFWFD